jgi:DNA-binding transcriptional LysR family regulator
LDLYQLKTFYIFGKVCSFTETANLLYVSQSAISHAIKKLEKSVGTKLVKRKGKAITLTAPGKDLYKSCQLIFNEIEAVTEKIDRHKKKFISEVSIGSPIEFGSTILIKHMKLFINQNEDIRVDFVFSNDLSRSLCNDEVDFIIDCKEHFSPELERINLFQEHYVVIASSDFIQNNRLKHISDLSNLPILSLDKECIWWKNFLASLDASNRPEFSHVIQINHVRGLINGAIQGLGISFVPKYTVLSELSEGILQEVFPEIQPQADHFCIYIKKDKLSKYKNKLLVDYLMTIRPAEFSGFD